MQRQTSAKAEDAAPAAPDTTPAGALTGMRVLDLTTVLMGPYATQILGDHGADIIKVEAPGGDTFRYPGPSRHRGMGPMFMNTNRNKRSLVLDLKNAEGRKALLELAKSVDIVVYNVRPAAMARLKLTYEDFRAVNPSVIYVGAFGFGQDGPYAARPAFDDVIQAASGLADLSSRAYGNGKPSYAPVNLCDRVVGLHLVSSILAAIVARERTGKGQSVEVPMFETMATFVLGDHLGWRTYDFDEGEMCYARIMTEFRRPFETKDGYMCIIPYVDVHWQKLLAHLGRTDLLADPRFKSQTSRSENIGVVYGFVDEVARMFTNAQWLVILEELDIPHTAVQSVEGLLTDPHLQQVGLFGRAQHPTEGEITTMRPTAIFSETPQSIRRHAPTAGQHSDEVLREAGFSEKAIADLRASGAVV
ncbi:MAG: CoA transferase [Pseudomonadota bacterium]